MLSNAFVAMATCENNKLIERAIGKYENKMGGLLGDGIEVEDLIRFHGACQTEAFTYFRENQAGDYLGEGLAKLEVNM